MPGQWEQQVQRQITFNNLGLPSWALPSEGGLVPDFPFPTHLLSVMYFCLDSQSGWVKMILTSVCFLPTRHTAAAEPQLPAFFHTAVPPCGLSQPAAAAPPATGCQEPKVPGSPSSSPINHPSLPRIFFKRDPS